MGRRIVIKCDGGFGNRYNSLLSGLVVARIFGLDVEVLWPQNNVCMASVSDLFSCTVPLSDTADLPPRSEFINLLHFENAPGQVAGEWVCNLKDMNALSDRIHASSRDILFSTSLIPAFLDLGIISQVMDGLQIRDTLRAQAEAFIAENQLGTFTGLHLRRTDFMANEAQDRAIEAMVANRSDLKFFVCSDSKETEDRLRAFGNVYIYPKNSYVDKLIDGDWRQEFTGSEGQKLRFNVLREADSVQQALVDLLILSRSELVETSASTFLKTAMLLRAKDRKLLRFSETYGQHFYARH